METNATASFHLLSVSLAWFHDLFSEQTRYCLYTLLADYIDKHINILVNKYYIMNDKSFLFNSSIIY